MTLENPHHVQTSKTISPARFGAAFSRNFKAEHGDVELAPGVSEPEVKVVANIITSAIGTEPQFWVVRASIAAYHAPSQRVVGHYDGLIHLPSSDKVLASLHGDEKWLAQHGSQGKSLHDTVGEIVDEAAQKALELANIWHAKNHQVNASLVSLREVFDSFKAKLQCALLEAAHHNS